MTWSQPEILASTEQLDALRRGVDHWNAWRERHPGVRPDLEEADLRRLDLASSSQDDGAVRLNLVEANLRGVRLEGADLRGAVLCEAELESADLSRANLSGVNLRSGNLRDARLVGARLNDAQMRDTTLDRADLSDSRLIRAHLGGARLKRARLPRADLRAAVLRQSYLWRTDLRGAHLMEADLRESHFRAALISDTRWNGAILGGTVLDEVDLGTVFALDEAVHNGPSLLSARSLVASGGNVPEVFLKGCGFGDWEIVAAGLYRPQLRKAELERVARRLVEAYGESPGTLSVFLSYGHQDEGFASRLAARLDGDGIRSWRASADSVPGPLLAQLESEIVDRSAVILVLSTSALRSQPVLWEVKRALQEESRSGKFKLFAVALDQGWKSDSWPDEVQTSIRDERAVLAFDGWQQESKFESAYSRLKDGLQRYADRGWLGGGKVWKGRQA